MEKKKKKRAAASEESTIVFNSYIIGEIRTFTVSATGSSDISKNDDIIYAHIMPILEAKWCTSPDPDFYSHIFNLFSCLIIYNV